MQAEACLVPMTAEMYHEYFREYQNDRDLYIDKSAFVPFTYDAVWVDRYIQRQADQKRKAFAIMYGDEIVGELIIKNIVEKQCATLSIAMKNAAYKDRGFGTAAERLAIRYVFDVLDIPILYADTVLTNLRSRHVLEKVGFRCIKEDDVFRYYAIER